MQNAGRKEQLLNFTPSSFITESRVNPERVFEVNRNSKNYDGFIYLTSRDLRVEDNFALNFIKEKNKDFKVVHLKKNFEVEVKNNFYLENLEILKQNYALQNIDFEILETDLKSFLRELHNHTLVIDFDPLVNDFIFENYNERIYEVDSHNIIPARIASDKQEYSAFTFRKKVYYKIYEYLTEFPSLTFNKNKAYEKLKDFIDVKLEYYPQDKNNPNIDGTSNLSPYINMGFISPQRIALEVINSDAPRESKEVFLEELIVRAELSDNFCLYNKNYKSFKSAPDWAQKSLMFHKNDLRPQLFTKKELEQAKTYDDLWNATQKQLMKDGKIHGYLRMYWAKKLLDWTKSPQEAIDIAVYLNDKYAYDGESPNGYVGILWSIAGLHDRAFKNYPVTGEIRRMIGIKTKLEKQKYIKKYASWHVTSLV